MKTKLITLCISLLMTLVCGGAVQGQSLVVWQKDGSRVSYNLDEQPRTTFTTEDLVITTTTTTISYPLSKIQRYTYEGGTLSVQDVKVCGISIKQYQDEITVMNLPVGKSATVFAIDGKLLLSKRSDGFSNLSLSLSHLPNGVYVIKAEEVTYKFTKR